MITLTSSYVLDSLPQTINVTYLETDSIAASTDSTALIEITLLSVDNDAPSYRNVPYTILTGEAYAIKLKGFGISCSSTNFNVRVLNVGNIGRINTINEIMRYDNIDRSVFDQDYNDFDIINKDSPMTNKIYLFIENNDAVNATGNIEIELIYVTSLGRI